MGLGFTALYLIVSTALYVGMYNLSDVIIRNGLAQALGQQTINPAMLQRAIDDAHAHIEQFGPISLVVTYVVLITVVIVMQNAMMRPLIGLTHYAERVSTWSYDSPQNLPQAWAFRDEVSTLAESFVKMVDKVREREANLKKQVFDLQIQIDHARRDKDVGEITDNEFFSDLKARAHELRQGSAAASPTPCYGTWKALTYLTSCSIRA